MKNLKKIVKYFVISFIIVLVCGFAGLVIQEADKGTFHDLATKDALAFCIQLVLTAFTALIPCSLSVATFLTFWAMKSGKWTYFFRTLTIGLVFVLPLSAMTYYYDWFISPQMKAVSAGELIERKSIYPRSLAYEFDIDKEQILNELPMTISRRRLIARRDSLDISFQADADTCGRLLSILPDTLASEAYESYRLKEMGLAYRYAIHPVADRDSLIFVQHVILYQCAIRSWDTLDELRSFRKEYFDRTLNTACIYIVYLVFAFTGYMLRYRPMKKILAILAILIAAASVYKGISSIIQAQAQKVSVVSRQADDKTYKKIKEIREKRDSSD